MNYVLYYLKAFIENREESKMGRSNSGNFIKRLQNGKEDALEWIYDNYIGFVKGIVFTCIN